MDQPARPIEDSGARCPKCGYNLTGAPGPRCPECGWMIDPETLNRASHRRSETAPPFSIDFSRRMQREQIITEWVGTAPTTSAELEAVLEENWQRRTAAVAEAGGNLYNGPMVRLVRWRQQDDCVRLELGPTDYRHFLGTNYLLGPAVEQIGIDAFANPLGVSAVTITRDGYLVFGRRAESVACHAGYLHAVGGTLDDGDRSRGGGFDVFDAIQRELREELALKESEIADCVCTGMVRDLDLHQPELVFDATLNLAREQVRARFDPQADGQEHQRLEWCYDEPESVVSFIQASAPFAPVAVGALLLHGRHDWGLDWYEAACFTLFGDLPPGTPDGIRV